MLCPDCRVESAADDDFCRRCGADLHAPVRSLVVAQPRLPVVFTNPQLPRVAAGVGAVAVGVGLELLRRGFFTRLMTRGARSAKTLPSLGSGLDLFGRNKGPQLRKGYEIQETIVLVNRVIRRKK